MSLLYRFLSLMSFIVPLKTFKMADTKFEHCIQLRGLNLLDEKKIVTQQGKQFLSLLLS